MYSAGKVLTYRLRFEWLREQMNLKKSLYDIFKKVINKKLNKRKCAFDTFAMSLICIVKLSLTKKKSIFWIKKAVHLWVLHVRYSSIQKRNKYEISVINTLVDFIGYYWCSLSCSLLHALFIRYLVTFFFVMYVELLLVWYAFFNWGAFLTSATHNTTAICTKHNHTPSVCR